MASNSCIFTPLFCYRGVIEELVHKQPIVMTCPRFPNVFEGCLKSIIFALDMRSHLTFLWAGSYIFARTHCFFFPQLMSRILMVRYEKQSLIVHCLLGLLLLYFCKNNTSSLLQRTKAQAPICFFLVFYCALNWTVPLFFWTKVLTGWDPRTHTTLVYLQRVSVWRLASK